MIPGDANLDEVGPAEELLIERLAQRLQGRGGVHLVEHDGDYVCYASKANSLVVRSEGRLGKCTVALSDAANDIGVLNPDGSLHVFRKKLQPWVRGLFSADPETLGCPWATMPQDSSVTITARQSLAPLETVV